MSHRGSKFGYSTGDFESKIETYIYNGMRIGVP